MLNLNLILFLPNLDIWLNYPAICSYVLSIIQINYMHTKFIKKNMNLLLNKLKIWIWIIYIWSFSSVFQRSKITFKYKHSISATYIIPKMIKFCWNQIYFPIVFWNVFNRLLISFYSAKYDQKNNNYCYVISNLSFAT